MAKSSKSRKPELRNPNTVQPLPATLDKFGRRIVPGSIVVNYADGAAGLVTHVVGRAVTMQLITPGEIDAPPKIDEQAFEPESAIDLIVCQTPEAVRRILIPPAATSRDLVNRCLLALEQIGHDVSYMTSLVTPFNVPMDEVADRRYVDAENTIREYLNEMLSTINRRAKRKEVDLITQAAAKQRKATRKSAA